MVLKTTDGGAHWIIQFNNAATRIFFDVTCRDNLKVWTCGYDGEITYSSDGGQTWVCQVQGMGKYATRIEFIDDTLGWAVCGDGLVGRTTDGGTNWEGNFTPYVAELYGVSFADASYGWAVAGWPDTVWVGHGYVLRSTDGGIHWEATLFHSGYEDYFDVHFFNRNEGIVVGGDESTMEPIILKTTNGGTTWFQIFIADTSARYLRAVDFVDSLGWAVGRSGTIIHTTNRGIDWAFQTNPATTTLFDVDFSDSLHGIACGYGIILYTTDGGNTWNIGEVPGIKEVSKWEVRNGRLIIYPNPFRNKLNIRYELPDTKYETMKEPISDISSPRSASLKIYDASGRLVRQWDYETIRQSDQILWDGTDDAGRKIPPGIYFVQLEADEFKKTEKAILLR